MHTLASYTILHCTREISLEVAPTTLAIF